LALHVLNVQVGRKCDGFEHFLIDLLSTATVLDGFILLGGGIASEYLGITGVAIEGVVFKYLLELMEVLHDEVDAVVHEEGRIFIDTNNLFNFILGDTSKSITK
jgi:hypothetical protein